MAPTLRRAEQSHTQRAERLDSTCVLAARDCCMMLMVAPIESDRPDLPTATDLPCHDNIVD